LSLAGVDGLIAETSARVDLAEEAIAELDRQEAKERKRREAEEHRAKAMAMLDAGASSRASSGRPPPG
jgi:hypothetical protein